MYIATFLSNFYFLAKIGIVSSQDIIYFLSYEKDDQSIFVYILEGLKLEYLQNLRVKQPINSSKWSLKVNDLNVISALF